MEASQATRFAILLPTILLAACAPVQPKDVLVGHACFREFAHSHSPRNYVCLFELSAPSVFYRPGTQDKIVAAFLSELRGDCEITGKWDMIRDTPYRLEHTTGYVVHHISCR